jgi:hypothetical protein
MGETDAGDSRSGKGLTCVGRGGSNRGGCRVSAGVMTLPTGQTLEGREGRGADASVGTTHQTNCNAGAAVLQLPTTACLPRQWSQNGHRVPSTEHFRPASDGRAGCRNPGLSWTDGHRPISGNTPFVRFDSRSPPLGDQVLRVLDARIGHSGPASMTEKTRLLQKNRAYLASP